MKRFCLLSLMLLFALFSNAQISVEFTNISDWIKNNFVGQGVVIGNINTHFPAKESSGIFVSNGVLKINNGLVLSTGDVRSIPSLNDKFNQSTGFNMSSKPEKDVDLEKIEKGKLYDITFIEFDFVPFNNSISFNYQFGSDEYPEYVGSAFNDVFAFIVSDENESKNIALIPNKNTPVSINTVNFKTDSAYYIDNNVFSVKTIDRSYPIEESEQEIYRTKVGTFLFTIKKFFKAKPIPALPPRQIIEADLDLIKKMDQKLYQNLQFDGITTKLVAQTYVIPYKKYHLKIIIADVSDNIYDSGVFLERGSLTAIKDTSQSGFVDYPDLSKQLDVARIFNGEKLEDVMPSELLEKGNETSSNHSVANKELSNPMIIYFDFDVDQPNETEMQKIYQIANEINSKGQYKYQIEVIGHTDSKGSLEYNLALSKSRSSTVASCLKTLITKPAEINVVFKAFNLPAISNETDEGRALNRRVELKIKEIKNE